jgi:hypothetical protein
MATDYSYEAKQIQQALLLLEEQMNKMRATAGTVETITQQVQTHYIAASSSLFASKMNDWIGQYNTVERSVNTLHDALERALQGMQRGESDALSAASGWSGGLTAVDSVSSVLAGN